VTHSLEQVSHFVVIDLKIPTYSPQFAGEKATQLFQIGRLKNQYFVKPAPYGSIKNTFVVGGCNKDAFPLRVTCPNSLIICSPR